MTRHRDAEGQGFFVSLGRTIKVARADLAIDRRELAERADISYSYLSAIENGVKKPSSAVLATIAEALGVRLHQLLETVERRQLRDTADSGPHWLDATDGVGLDTGASQASTQRPSAMTGGVAKRDGRPTQRDPFITEMERLSGNLTAPNKRLLLDMARKLAN